jgi:hypothetical protein
MLVSVQDVYAVNKGFSFAPRPLNSKSNTALRWLKNYDPGLYYTATGGGYIYWDWTPVAYNLEMPIINFDYGRRLVSQDAQRGEDSPFFATAKYVLTLPDQPLPENAELLKDFDGVGLWYLPDALPYAFSADPAYLQPYTTLAGQPVSPLSARLDSPNRVVVTGEPGQSDDHLVVLVSDYPGWQLRVDGQTAELSPVNGYLGAEMLPGKHTYTFTFSPGKHYIGLTISLLALAFTLGLVVVDTLRLQLPHS